jgi:transposase
VSQLFKWRKELCKRNEGSGPSLVPVAIFPEASIAEAEQAPPAQAPARQRKSQGIIEIELGGGDRVRVDCDVDGDALRRVLDALARR